jgi:DNA (cytosine-5)-methyltransferase 1
MSEGKKKILNLYAGIGGNRKLWGDDYEITAVEYDNEIAEIYKDHFPNDKVIVADAHQYLLDHYKEFDFIWSSPPCPSHSRARFARRETTSSEYPDLKLYEEIFFLENWFGGKYVVENVIPYYEPLIPAQKRGRHLYWTNFKLPQNLNERKSSIMEGKDEVTQWCEFHDYDFRKYKGEQRLDKMARNLVDYEAGKTIFETALGIINKSNTIQTDLFM